MSGWWVYAREGLAANEVERLANKYGVNWPAVVKGWRARLRQRD